MLYQRMENQKVKCLLCGHKCALGENAYGTCLVRQNIGGKLVTWSSDSIVAMNIDPIEKKPLFHFLPGSTSMSIAAAGCNFKCSFCQNWQISQSPRIGSITGGEAMSPEQIVALAKESGCASISYTYTEPTIFFELAYDTAVAAREQGLLNCFVSNGYMTPLAISTIRPYLDAINVDLKAFRDETYRNVMKARLEPVLTCLKTIVKEGIWLEVTTLIVPGMNDSPQELGDIARFISGELGPGVPWHVSRFHGDFEMNDVPTTPLSTMELAIQIGRQAGLHYVYGGNVGGRIDESTFCPDCGKPVIKRSGFAVRELNLRDGGCNECGRAIEGIWSAKR